MDALQEDTLVLAAHRGHRLGAGLKARNLRTLIRGFPKRRRVHTWTAEVNGAMQRINQGFGFRVVENTHEFQKTARD